MDFYEYQDETERTAPQLGSELEDQLHMVVGISTEAGELLDAYKKHWAYGKELDRVNVKEELGDLLWYMSNLMRMLDIDFERTLETNVAKLKARYKEKFSTDEALNRDLKVERMILESPFIYDHIPTEEELKIEQEWRKNHE